MELTPVVTLTGTTFSVPAEGVSSTLLDPTIPVYFNLMIRRPESVTAYADAILAGQKSALSYEEFTQRFSTSEEDMALIEAFAQATGLTVLNSHLPSATVKLTGTAFQVNMAFGIDLITVITEEDRSYMSYIGTITIPAVLDGIIEYIIGLDNSIKFEPRVTALNYPTDTFLTPLQVAKAYNFPPADGSGVCIGIIALGGAYNAQNISDSFSQANINLPPPNIVNVFLDANGNVAANGSLISSSAAIKSNQEVMLDIFVAACVAPKAKIAMYFSYNNPVNIPIDLDMINSINYALHDSINKPNVLSLSFGALESTITSNEMTGYNGILAQSTVLGIPICAGAGNRGASFPTSVPNERIGFPDCSPYVLGCGGTSLTLNQNGTIKSEVVWNNPNLLSEGKSGESAAGGSGISSFNPVPSYQAGLTYTPCTVLADGTNQTNGLTITLIDGSLNTNLPYQGRVYPDVVGNSDQSTGYRFYYDACGNGFNSSLIQAGGTSACAPLYAGLFARCFQLSGNTALKGPSGNFINTLLYANREFAFNDISGGNNVRRGNTGGYACTAGWDAATGLGSPKGMKILSLLNGSKTTILITTVSAYQPTIGTSGTVIDISGYGFTAPTFTNGIINLGSGTVVTLNNTTCVSTVLSSTHLQCIVPSSILSSGTYDLVVTNPHLFPSTFAMPFVYYLNNVYTFTPTSGKYQYPNIPIPQGATSVQITAVGGGGGGATSYSGGSGAKVINTYPLTGTGITSLNVNIGGGGKNRINLGGGGGGGLTQVISNNNGTAINIVAGGGGGASTTISGNNAGLPNGLTSYDGNFNQLGSGGQVVANGNGAGSIFNSQSASSAVSGSIGGGGSGSYLINGGTNATDSAIGGVGGVGGGGTGASASGSDNGGGGGGGGYGGGSGGSNSLLIKSGGGGSIALRNGTAESSATYSSGANGGLANTSGGDGFVIIEFITYPAPTISSINLTSGGSTSIVTITGTNFLISPLPLPTVSLVGVSNTTTAGVTQSCTVNYATATEIQVQVPSMSINGSYDFIVTNNDGQISAINNTTSRLNYYLNPVPITSITPSSGTVGSVIDISGYGFTAPTFTNGIINLGTGTVVTLNNTTCVSTVLSPTHLQCIVPSSILSSGTYDLVVTNPNSLPSTFAMPFVYYLNNVYTFTPTSGTYQYPNIPIPQGATSVQITAVGGGGGGGRGNSAIGGNGATITTLYSLSNADISLNINIGGGGGGSITNCGGGGGLTQIISNSNRINVIAGGGGGAGLYTNGGNAGNINGNGDSASGDYGGGGAEGLSLNAYGIGGNSTYSTGGNGGTFGNLGNLGSSRSAGGAGLYVLSNNGGGGDGSGGGGGGGDGSSGGGGGGAGAGGGGAGAGGSSGTYGGGGGSSIALLNGALYTTNPITYSTLSGNGGLKATSGSDGFVIIEFITSTPPTISSISQTSGGSTSTVTITGTNFLTSPLPTVSLVGVTGTATAGVITPCTVNSANATSIQVQVPFMFINGLYNFRVTNNDGRSAINTSLTFNYNVNPVPTITSITPSSGTAGSAIDIVGTNFVQGAIVKLETVTCIATVIDSSNIRIPSLPLLTNIKAINTNTITVTNPGTASSASFTTFNYTTPQPTIIGVRDFTSGIAITTVTSGQSIILDVSNLLLNFDLSMNGTIISQSVIVRTVQSTGIITVRFPVPTLGISDGSYNITVTNNKGVFYNSAQASLSSSYQIQYVEGAPTISSIVKLNDTTPLNSIYPPFVVTISGLNFNNPTVTMNGLICEFSETNTLTQILVLTPFITQGVIEAGISTSFVVTNQSGESITYNNSGLIYHNPFPYFKTALNITTGSGLATGIYGLSSSVKTGSLTGTAGNTYDMSGEYFITTTTITLNNVLCNEITIISNTHLTFKVPFIAASSGTYNLVMASPRIYGSDIRSDKNYIYPFQYSATASVISNINSGAAVSTGSTVTVTGSNFYGTPIIQIGTIQYTNVSVAVATNGNSLTFTAPFLSDGLTSYSLTVIQDGISSNNQAFTYTIPLPSLITFTPSFGVNGSTITVSGTNICSNATFTINSVNATKVANTYSSSSNGSQTSNQIQAPINPSGSYKINVTNPGKFAVPSEIDFTYTNPPTVTACNPSFGTDNTQVIITGTNFLAGLTVTIGNGNATSVNVTSSISLTCIVPSSVANTINGYFIKVTNPSQYTGQNPLLSGTSGTRLFGYINPITANVAVSPLTIANNTPITVTGTNFLDGAKVTFNGSADITAYNVSSTRLTFNVPSNAFSTNYGNDNYPIVITNPAEVVGGVTQSTGIPTTTITPSFSYNPQPTISGISPSSGQAGTIVDISGAGFLTNPSVVINDVAYPATRVSATQIRFFMPALGSNGTYLLAVQNTDIQKSATRAPFVFTVPAPPFVLPFAGAIVIPPNFIGSMFTNNTNYYKPGSHSAGANGVRNSRALRRRT